MPVSHVLVVYENWSAAHRSGGDFVLILDNANTEYFHLERQGMPMDMARDAYLADLDWLGFPADRVLISLDNEDAHREAAKALADRGFPLKKPSCDDWDRLAVRFNRLNASSGPDPELGFAPMTHGHNNVWHPYYLLQTVVDDTLERVTEFVRGDDLIAQWFAYQLMCDLLDVPRVGQTYIKTVKKEGANGKMSKSEPVELAPRVRDLRLAGWKPKQILATLIACAEDSRWRTHIEVPKGVLETDEVRPLYWFGGTAAEWYNHGMNQDPLTAEGRWLREHARECKAEFEKLQAWGEEQPYGPPGGSAPVPTAIFEA
jgi:hypothetical protein